MVDASSGASSGASGALSGDPGAGEAREGVLLLAPCALVAPPGERVSSIREARKRSRLLAATLAAVASCLPAGCAGGPPPPPNPGPLLNIALGVGVSLGSYFLIKEIG